MSMKMLWLLLVLPLEEAPQFWGLQGWNVSLMLLVASVDRRDVVVATDF